MADEKGKGKSPEEEINQYLDILAMDPTSRVFARLAEAYRKSGRIDEAVSVCRDGLQDHPGYTAGQVVLARALFDGGKSAEARVEISKVIAAAPDNLTAQKLLAQIDVRLNDHDAAVKAYRMVQLLDPSDEEAQLYLAAAGGGAAEKPPSLPAYEAPPIEHASPPPPAVAAEAPAPAGEAGMPPGLTFEREPAAAVETESASQVEAAAPVSTEPVFDLGEMEAAAAEEEVPAAEAPVDDSPFEVFTKEPRYDTPPEATVEEKAEPFAEIEFSTEDDLDVEPVMEEPPVVIEEATVAGVEELTEEVMELVIDDVEPVMEEPPPAAEEMVAEEAEPLAESGDDFDIFKGEEEMEGSPGGEPSAAGVFNTETLANLYITQGFYGKAADVYRQMLSELPDNVNLRQKLEEVLALEKMQSPSVEEVPVDFEGEATRQAPVGTESPVIEELQRLMTKLKEKPR